MRPFFKIFAVVPVICFLVLLPAYGKSCSAAYGHGNMPENGETNSPAYGQSKKKESYLDRFIGNIMENLRSNAVKYNSIRPDYEALVYVNSNSQVLERNFLQKYIPYLNKLKSGTDHYEAEFLGTVTFTNPSMYNQIYFPITSISNKFMEKHIEKIVPKNMKLNVYSQYLTGDTYSPLAYKGAKYYKYSLDSIWQRQDHTYYKIKFTPRIENYKFVEGYLIATDRNWSIREMRYSSGTTFIGYNIHVIMGDEGSPDEFLPQIMDMSTRCAVLGTKLKGNYNARIRYKSIEESHFIKENGEGKEKYNLTHLYNTKNDTISSLANFIVKFRDSSDTYESAEVTGMPSIKSEEMEHKEDSVGKAGTFAKMGGFIIKNNSVDLKRMGELKLPPLISPVLFNYSTHKGLSYTQKFRYRRVTPKDKMVYIEPRIGYNFKYKEFYWGVKGEVNYQPKLMSRIFVDIGNGNKIETDRIRNELSALPFMVFDSTKLNLMDFRNGFARIGHKIEIANGLNLSTNLSFQVYNERNKSDLTIIYPQSLQVQRSKEIARHSYRTFVPEIEIAYTPHQYYHYNGNRKEYLYSSYPTFTVNYARAIKGVFNSTTEYDKIEFDMNQKRDIGPMHKLFYRVGAGGFFNSTDLFFAEFNYLRKNNLPSGWDDDIGGAFHLLNRHQYNEIEKYLRVNLQYDAPILLMTTLLRRVKYITKEKLYCNLLFTDTMKPYMEIGYGIGTHLFNVGLFWGGEINKWDTAGVKFSLEFE